MSYSSTAARLLIVCLTTVVGFAASSVADSGTVTPDGQGGAVTPRGQSAEERYDAAEAALAAGDAAGALQIFTAIVDDFPRSRYPSFPRRAAANVRAGQIELERGRAEAGAARFVAVIDGEPASEWTARARFGLATTLLWSREWPAASRLLQAIVDASASDGPEADIIASRAAEARLTLLHRLWLRPAAGEQPWQRAGRLAVDVTFDRPIGIAAGFDSVLVTDEGADTAIFIDASGTATSFGVADPRRPWWGPSADGFVAARSAVNAPRRVESFQFVYPDGARQRALGDIRAGVRTPDGGWFLLDNRFKRVMRFGADGGFESILDIGADGEPVDLARGPRGRLFVIEKRRRGVVVFDAAGALLSGFSVDGWREPYAVAVDAIGYVYVLDRGLKRIDVFDADGGMLWTLGPVLPSGVELRDPRDLTVDATGRILIADRGLRAVVVIE